MFITPKNYRGKVTVIFNQANGVPEKFSGKKRVFNIPSNGVLRTRSKSKSGFFYNPRYYYRSTDSQLNSLIRMDLIEPNPQMATAPGMELLDSLVI